MGFLERAIRRGISDGVGKAVGEAISKAIEPTATELANKAAAQIDSAAQNSAQQSPKRTSGFEGAFANLERAAQGYATEMSKNMKICPKCNEPTTADKKFCPSCGEKLPEQTVAEGAVCSACGKQNSIGTKFCEDCGTKLPATIMEEEAAAAHDSAVMDEWDEKLSVYPKWSCGGNNFYIEQYETDVFMFCANFAGDNFAAKNAVKEYRTILLENGFRQAGQYPSEGHLYKMLDGVCYHVDTEHCFEGDPDCPSIGFLVGEPHGGFDFVKPEPKKTIGFKDLFEL